VNAINSHTSTNYIEFAASFPVTGRDFSFLQHIQRESDGTYVVSWHSIKDPSIPKKKGVVRASMGNSGFIITPIKPFEPSQPMRSLVTFVVQFDYKGKSMLFKIKSSRLDSSQCNESDYRQSAYDSLFCWRRT
jgi:hypothetical protein